MSTTTAAPSHNANDAPGMPTAVTPTSQKFLVIVPFVDCADNQPDFKTFIAEAASLDDAYARFQASLKDKN